MAAVRRRKIFYISGFDPRGASFYHSLFRDEAQRQCALSGNSVEVGRRRRDGPLCERWDVKGRFSYQEVSTDYVFLRWDDLVRQQWTRTLPAIVAEAFSTLTGYAHTGLLPGIYRTQPAIFQTLIYTAVLMTALALVALGLGALAAWGVSAGLGAALWSALLAGLMTAGAVLCTWPMLEKRLNPLWASRATTFILVQGQGRVPGLDDKLAAFAGQIVAAAQAAEHDEILVVAHSSGVQLAVSTMAMALAQYPTLGRQGTPVSLLTLGGSIPLLAMLPTAQFFRDRLKVLALARQICWVDFNQITDWTCWAPSELFELIGMATPPGAPRPLAHSPRIHTLFSAQRYEALKRDRLRLHFQYLMAGEKLGEYDFFAIACGPVALSERFAHRADTAESAQLP